MKRINRTIILIFALSLFTNSVLAGFVFQKSTEKNSIQSVSSNDTQIKKYQSFYDFETLEEDLDEETDNDDIKDCIRFINFCISLSFLESENNHDFESKSKSRSPKTPIFIVFQDFRL